GRVVGGGVDARLEPGRPRPLEDPGAGRDVRVAERRAADPAHGGRPDRRERLEVLAQQLPVDAHSVAPLDEAAPAWSPDEGAALDDHLAAADRRARTAP